MRRPAARPHPIEISLETARRLAVLKQHLAGKVPRRASDADLLRVVRDVCYIQWDPIAVVARSHLLAFWSRLGTIRPEAIDRLLFGERKIFLHWSHAASIVLTEDYPLHASLMHRYPESISDSWGTWRASARRWLPTHRTLRTRVLQELKRRGPLRMGEFREHRRGRPGAGGWSFGSDVARMLTHLQMMGEVMIVGHDGNQNVWGLSGDFLPEWVPRTALSADAAEREGALRSIRALGTASPTEINLYFLRGRYLRLPQVLGELASEGAIHPVRVVGLGSRDVRYIDDRDVQLIDATLRDGWEPRTTLLSPFDNLTSSSARTKLLFGFDPVIELYKPAAKRRYGYYVLPILRGDRFIGRIDPRMDHRQEKLVIQAVHAEPRAPRGRAVASEIGASIDDLARRLGAREVVYPARIPEPWRGHLA